MMKNDPPKLIQPLPMMTIKMIIAINECSNDYGNDNNSNGNECMKIAILITAPMTTTQRLLALLSATAFLVLISILMISFSLETLNQQYVITQLIRSYVSTCDVDVYALVMSC